MTYVASVIVVLAAATTAAAEPRAIAHVDEIVVAGGPEIAQARAFAVGLVRRAGMDPRFADEAATPCGDDGACLADRARTLGAVVALRLTIAEVGDRVIVSMLASDARGKTRSDVVPSIDLDRGDDRLATLLRELAPPTPPPRSRLAAWSLLGASAALAIGGGIATWYAHDQRSAFYEEHVAENGDVFGISPADARAEERRARQWSLIGGFALGAAAIAGTGAAILFVRNSHGESRPAGVSVAWEFP
jgi:hypothetical protein